MFFVLYYITFYFLLDIDIRARQARLVDTYIFIYVSRDDAVASAVQKLEASVVAIMYPRQVYCIVMMTNKKKRAGQQNTLNISKTIDDGVHVPFNGNEKLRERHLLFGVVYFPYRQRCFSLNSKRVANDAHGFVVGKEAGQGMRGC